MVLREASRLRVRLSTLCVRDARDVSLIVKLWLLFVSDFELEQSC